jgi:hypothetical protein
MLVFGDHSPMHNKFIQKKERNIIVGSHTIDAQLRTEKRVCNRGRFLISNTIPDSETITTSETTTNSI